MPDLYSAIKILKALIEICGYALLGQGIVFVFAADKREENGVYKLFRWVNRPAFKLTRAITPKAIMDQHIPFVAFFVVLFVWLVLVAALLYIRYQIVAAGGTPP